MKRKILILIVLVAGSSAISGQKILTLKECYDRAAAKSALASEKEAYSGISALKDLNLSKGWLPTLDANGSFVYNSSVVDMKSALGALPIPGIADAIKPLPHEQYKITVDINQVIYDGGAIKGARELEKADLSVNEKQTEADLYKLKGQINGCYFSILLLDKQKELIKTHLEIIVKRISSMESAIRNGVILKTDLDVLTSQRIMLDQQITEITIKRESLVKILSDLTGTEIDQPAEFMIPFVPGNLAPGMSRPEIQLFDLRKEQLGASLKIVDSRRMPRAYGFATLGYGNPPGSNFFKDEFAPYYIVGAGVKWNIFDWNRVKNEKKVISLQQSIIDNRKADLTDNLSRMLEAKNAEIMSLKALIESDNELIAIRKRITAAAESQYDNGTITATEYMNEMNAERQALVNSEIHKINLSMAGIEYLNISGKEIE
jgi:outer membrane protein TolC